MAAAEEISGSAAMAAALSQADGTFTLKEQQRSALMPFLGGRHCFSSLPTLERAQFNPVKLTASSQTRGGDGLLVSCSYKCDWSARM